MKLRSAAPIRAAILLATLAMPLQTVLAQSASNPPATPTASNNTLSAYWPFGTAPRTWSLVNKRGVPSMTVTNATTGPGKLDLVFTHAARVTQNGGGFNAGVQRYCDNAGDPFLFLDGYAAFTANGSISQQHSVTSTRLILTPEGGRPIDLIADGTYARCGNKGQPYLRWNLDMPSYRLQAWGYVTGHMENRWYWDVTVSAPKTFAKDPCGLQPQLTAIAVQEAWWSNFNGTARWGYGSGSTGANGIPTGANVTYGRTDWHSKGHMPWYMVTSGSSVMCTDTVENGTVLPLASLMQQ